MASVLESESDAGVDNVEMHSISRPPISIELVEMFWIDTGVLKPLGNLDVNNGTLQDVVATSNGNALNVCNPWGPLNKFETTAIILLSAALTTAEPLHPSARLADDSFVASQ